MIWILHHWQILLLIGGIAVLCVWQPAIARRHWTLIAGIVVLALIAQFIYDKGAASQAAAVEKAKAEATVAKKDAATAETSADIADRAITAGDAAIAMHRRNSQATLGVIDERIRHSPVRTADSDDPAILQAVDQARARAQGAEDSVRGTQGTVPNPKPARKWFK